MRTSVAARTAGHELNRPAWWVPTIGTLAIALAALLAGAVLTGRTPAPAPDAPTLQTPFSKVAKTTAPVSRIASFNVLGANHTDGKRAKKRQFANSAVRTANIPQILSNNGVDIVGFQELNRTQHDRFMGLVGKKWDMYPGDELTHYATHNSIAWRTAEWKLVDANTIPITYFNGTLVPMPYLLLRHIATKRLLWVANFHNPGSTRHRPPQHKWRAKAKNAQIGLANRLHKTGVPLIITGDMNERETYHCSMTSRAPMKAANGGSVGTSRCVAPRDTRIDWIFGSTRLRLFHYLAQRTPLVQQTTDHPVVLSDVAIPRSKLVKNP
jgi:endonuclease/exonuclease/phosphatase family metal-dependent hydrolase